MLLERFSEALASLAQPLQRVAGGGGGGVRAPLRRVIAGPIRGRTELRFLPENGIPGMNPQSRALFRLPRGIRGVLRGNDRPNW
jgi:hypothetical protein